MVLFHTVSPQEATGKVKEVYEDIKETKGIDFIQNRKPGPQGQVRDNRLCHKSNPLMVSGVRFQVSVNTES